MEILQEIANKIGFDWKLAFTHLINLLLIFFLLAKFALPSIQKVVNERTKKIEEGLKMREQADKIVENANSESLQIVKYANQKAESIVSKAESGAKEIVLNANSKASEIIQFAEKEKELAKEKGLREAENILVKDIQKILSKISANAFGDKISADVNNDFVSKVFKM